MMHTRTWLPALCALALMPTVVACGAEGGDTPPSPTAATPAAMVTPGVNPNPELALPFAVDSVFSPSGYEGDGSVAPSSTNMTPHAAGDTTTCNRQRSSATAQGHCHIVSYSPSAAAIKVGHLGWSGVYWQFPSNNWGTLPGANVAPGATRIRFSARGVVGGEVVTFGAGGVSAAKSAFGDSFAISQKVSLTTEWQEFSLPLTGAQYGYAGNGVLGGFYWTFDSKNLQAPTETASFYVDDIVYE